MKRKAPPPIADNSYQPINRQALTTLLPSRAEFLNKREAALAAEFKEIDRQKRAAAEPARVAKPEPGPRAVECELCGTHVLRDVNRLAAHYRSAHSVSKPQAKIRAGRRLWDRPVGN